MDRSSTTKPPATLEAQIAALKSELARLTVYIAGLRFRLRRLEAECDCDRGDGWAA
jgi:hypothetical protein